MYKNMYKFTTHSVSPISHLQRNTSRQSKPLRVQVMHSSVVAHQCFALKALSWLGQIIQYSGRSGLHFPYSSLSVSTCCWTILLCSRVSDGLRRILCQVGLQKGPEGENSSLVDRLMLNDSKMWKGNDACMSFCSVLYVMFYVIMFCFCTYSVT